MDLFVKTCELEVLRHAQELRECGKSFRISKKSEDSAVLPINSLAVITIGLLLDLFIDILAFSSLLQRLLKVSDLSTHLLVFNFGFFQGLLS